jgi:hypothetical protein
MRALGLVLFPSFLLSGCIAWSSGPVPETPVAGAERVRADLSLHTAFQADIAGVTLSEDQEKKASKEIEEIIAEVFSKSGRYRVDQGTAGYTLEVDITDSGNPNTMLALISGATLGVIPAWATDSYVTDVRLLDATNETLKSTRFVHDQTVLIQILLLPAMPFAFPGSVNKRMWRNVSQQMMVWTDNAILAHSMKPKPRLPVAVPPVPDPAPPTAPPSPPPVVPLDPPPVTPPEEPGPVAQPASAGAK